MKAFISCLAGVGISISATLAAAQDVQIKVNSDKVIKTVDDRLYGQFLEHIYHSMHGGLWGEIVWNRSFEEAPPAAGGRGAGGGGGRGRGAAGATQPAPVAVAPATAPSAAPAFPIRHWLAVGAATITVDIERPLNSSKSAKIITDAGGGIAQNNFAVRKGDICRGSIFVRGTAPDGLTVKLVQGATTLAEQTISGFAADWKEFPLELNPSAASGDASLQIVSKGKAEVWIDQVSLMPDSFNATGGFRPDLLQAVMDLKPATVRWPGGSYVHTSGGYDWKGGIGPQSKRVGKIGWDELDPSAFGVDEFIALCRKINTEPVIVVYMGPQTTGADRSKQIQDAADWVEYCNAPATTKWGALRAANGHAEPYNVKYWEIDNEVWNTEPAEYVKILNDFAPAMKKIAPKITVIGCGSGGFAARFGEGDVAVIQQASDVVDFLSLHHYENAANYATGPGLADAYFNKMGALIDKSKNPEKFKIYFSEWNLRTSIDWRTGLYAGGILNTMEKNKYVTMACPALWLRHSSAGTNWDNAFINFDHNGWFPAPNYVVMKLYRDHFAPNLVELTGETSGLNIAATKTADGKKLILKVVNPTENAMNVKVGLTGAIKSGKATMQLVAPGDLMARNSFTQRDAVKPVIAPTTLTNGEVGFAMPKWSVGVVDVAGE